MPASTSLTDRTVKSATWLFGRKLFTNLLQLVTVAILARQLSPGDFGLVALAQVLLGFVLVLNASGVSTYVIYDRAEGREERVEAAFWVGLTMMAGIVACFFISLPWVASFYSQPDLSYVLTAYMVGALINQLRIVPEGLIKRGMNYQLLVMRDSVFDLAAAALKVAMALTGWGVWSLVLPELFMQPLRLLVTYRMARWKPSLRFGFKYWRVIFRYVASISGSNLLGLVANDGDTLLIGRLLGTSALGIYDLAWNLSNVATANIVSVVNEIAMPALAQVGEDLNRLRQAYIRMLRYLGLVSFPMLVGMFVVADDLVTVIYGPKWAATVPILRIFIIHAIRRSIGSPVGTLFNVRGRPDIPFIFDLAFAPIYLLSIFVGSKWGLAGIAAAVTFIRTAGGFVTLYLAARILSTSLWPTLAALFKLLLVSVTMGLVVWSIRMGSLQDVAEPWLRLLILVLSGALVYPVLLHFSEKSLFRECSAVGKRYWLGAYTALKMWRA